MTPSMRKVWRPTTRSEALAVVEEAQRRVALKKLTLVDDNFAKQAAFQRDPSRRKAAKCTRRAGKTTAVARGLIDACIKNDGVATLYIGLTIGTCRRMFWEDALKPTLNLFRGVIKCKLIESRLEVHFPNGSRIYCLGMDANKDEMQKLLGGKYKRVVIDEAGSFTVDLESMIDEMIWPSLTDLQGDIWLTGTPTEFTGSYFHTVTQDEHPEERPEDWSVHEWGGYDNPYIAENWAKDLAEILRTRPRFIETPAYKRMWLGKWCIDASSLVYKYQRDRNWLPKLPRHESEYTYGLGVDLGYDDACSFVLSAYSRHERTLYLLRPFKKSGMDITATAEKIKEYIARYNVMSLVIDGSNKQAVEEMRKRHRLPTLLAADKTGKANFIDIFNSEMIAGEIMLVGPDADIIEFEYANLIWDKKALERRNKREEHPGCENHLCDAALYIWRNQRQYLYRPEERPESKTDEQRMDEWEEREAMKNEKSSTNWWERMSQ